MYEYQMSVNKKKLFRHVLLCPMKNLYPQVFFNLVMDELFTSEFLKKAIRLNEITSNLI